MQITRTRKLYIAQPYLKACAAHVVASNDQGVIFDQTVAFPEGGGQAGDSGYITIGKKDSKNQQIIPFTNTQQIGGRLLLAPNLPAINVETAVVHYVAHKALTYFVPGTLVQIAIDIERRAKLTVNHTGLHLVLMGLEYLRPTIAKFIKGCRITTEYSRIDFFVREKFSSKDLDMVTDIVNNLVVNSLPITSYADNKESEVCFWKCQETIYPCGGTHLPVTEYVGAGTVIRRKSIGKSLERIIAYFPNAKLPVNLFY